MMTRRILTSYKNSEAVKVNNNYKPCLAVIETVDIILQLSAVIEKVKAKCSDLLSLKMLMLFSSH